jgi:hypothetical protein
MILSRLLSFIVRGFEFLISLVRPRVNFPQPSLTRRQTLLGLVGHFLHRYDVDGEGPHGRMIFAEVVAAVSTLLSLVWLVPFTWTFMHYPLDFLMAAAWFASFAAWYTWISQNGLTCAGVFGIWNFDGNLHDYYCDEWRVVEGLAFLSGLLWLLSACLVPCRAKWSRQKLIEV